jgi:hypothetical protein
VEVPPRRKTTTATFSAIVINFFTGMEFLVLDVLSQEEESNHDHFLAFIAP